jgi:hypothetical protein
MKEILKLFKSWTESLNNEAPDRSVDKKDPLWNLAKTEYSNDPIYAYMCLKKGRNPNA